MSPQNNSGGALGGKDTRATPGRDAVAPPLGTVLFCPHCGLMLKREIIIGLAPDDDRQFCQWDDDNPNLGNLHEWTDRIED